MLRVIAVVSLLAAVSSLAASCGNNTCVGSTNVSTCCGSSSIANCSQTDGCQAETILPAPDGSPAPCGENRKVEQSCVPTTQPPTSGGASCDTLDHTACLQREDCAVTLQTTCTSTGGFGSQTFSCGDPPS
jgi:hypothetical protein